MDILVHMLADVLIDSIFKYLWSLMVYILKMFPKVLKYICYICCILFIIIIYPVILIFIYTFVTFAVTVIFKY